MLRIYIMTMIYKCAREYGVDTLLDTDGMTLLDFAPSHVGRQRSFVGRTTTR